MYILICAFNVKFCYPFDTKNKRRNAAPLRWCAVSPFLRSHGKLRGQKICVSDNGEYFLPQGKNLFGEPLRGCAVSLRRCAVAPFLFTKG